jgi:hypothetical protein
MDPASINNIFSLLAFLALVMLGIIQLRLGRGKPADQNSSEPVNGNPVSANYVKRVVAEHERDCKVREEIEELRKEMQAGFRNVSEDFRGVHERLDRSYERRRE